MNAENYEEMSAFVAAACVNQLRDKPNSVFGLATGETPLGFYRALVDHFEQGDISLAEAVTFNLDEYVGLEPDNPASYRSYMEQHFFQHVDIRPENCHLPNGNAEDLLAECVRYEAKIAANGGVDLQILGIGVNGHIGFNEPGTAFSSKTHIVTLAESTRDQNARFFRSPDEMPRQAITMGIDTIMKAKKIILLASGEHKKTALKRLEADQISEDFPAAILRKHPHVTVLYGN